MTTEVACSICEELLILIDGYCIAVCENHRGEGRDLADRFTKESGTPHTIASFVPIKFANATSVEIRRPRP